ncbi:MAG: hypothetical protein KDC92_12480, partial [Bacteroidetes bacterium]|nr:hypothetical protein [Bacteroidota bacterium]
MGRVVILLVFVMGAFGLLAQESQVYSVTTTYTPPENGFKMSIQFRYKFINCFGEVALAITKDKDKATPISYIYNGIEYSLSGLAVDVQKEMRTNIGLTDVKADLYHSTNRLGALTLSNVIDWDIGGCFGQTYHVTKMLGLSDAAYKEHVAELLLKNLYISSMSNRSYKIEGLLKEVEKQKGYDTKMSEAASLKSQRKYDAAKAAYKDALRLKPNDPTAISKLNELETEMKEKANEVEADRVYEEGKKHESNGSLEAAKEAYEKAAQLHPEHTYAASKAKEMANNIAKAKQKLREVEKAHIDASNRSMNFVIEGSQTGSAAHGSATQETWMIG